MTDLPTSVWRSRNMRPLEPRYRGRAEGLGFRVGQSTNVMACLGSCGFFSSQFAGAQKTVEAVLLVVGLCDPCTPSTRQACLQQIVLDMSHEQIKSSSPTFNHAIGAQILTWWGTYRLLFLEPYVHLPVPTTQQMTVRELRLFLPSTAHPLTACSTANYGPNADFGFLIRKPWHTGDGIPTTGEIHPIL